MSNKDSNHTTAVLDVKVAAAAMVEAMIDYRRAAWSWEALLSPSMDALLEKEDETQQRFHDAMTALLEIESPSKP